MQTEIRLKQILDAANFRRHGRIQRIAREAQINRHTVRKLYHNESAVFSLETITKICHWLERQHLGEGLPGRLFAARPSELLRALREKDVVTFYLGTSTGEKRSKFARAWVARDDAGVAAQMVQQLSQPAAGEADGGSAGVAFAFVHTPSRSGTDALRRADRRVAEAAFREMRSTRRSETPVIIGSQRANNVCELFVADLFRTKPWRGRPGVVPLYLKYHEPDDSASCFGGFEPPPWDPDGTRPGIHFRPRAGEPWRFFESVDREQGVGVAIVRRDPGRGRLELAAFGLSGIATAVMGRLLCEMPGRFWPSGSVQAGLEIGVFVCRFGIGDMVADDQDLDSVRIGSPEIVGLAVDVPGKRRRGDQPAGVESTPC